MFTYSGRPETPFKPTPGRIHPKEGSFLAREVKEIKNADGIVIGKSIGRVVKRRPSLMGLRDNAARVSKRADRFVEANGWIDRRLDTPEPSSVPVTSVTGCHRGRRRGSRKLRLIDKV